MMSWNPILTGEQARDSTGSRIRVIRWRDYLRKMGVDITKGVDAGGAEIGRKQC